MINYISKGSSSVDAAEKIKVAFEERRLATNPFLAHRLSPSESEGFKTGGGTYRFENVLGYPAAVRRSGKPTSNTVDYEDGMQVVEVTLTVSQPYMTKLFTFDKSDAIQMDGIDFSPKSSKKVMNSLVKTEIAAEAAIIKNNTGLRKETLTGDSSVKLLIEVKDQLAKYYDISSTNGWDDTATRYFDANRGDFLEEELRVHLHPSTIASFSNVNTENGTGSEAQFAQFEKGTLKFINGVEVVSNKYVDPNQILIMPTQMIGTPDEAVMTTEIKQFEIEQTNTNHIRGWHYFDAVLVTPELITLLTLPAPAKTK